MPAQVDVLIPSAGRVCALIMTLTALHFQERVSFHATVSDQSGKTLTEMGEIQALLRLYKTRGRRLTILKHLPRKGMAEQRQFLLDQTKAGLCLFLDDDIFLERGMLWRLTSAICRHRCGFVGAAPIGLSYIADLRPHEQRVEFWKGRVQPEKIVPRGCHWSRHLLHNAANIYHLQQRLKLASRRQRAYKVAWIGGCVMYDTRKLRAAGGYQFWRELPASHCGEDVLAQLRVMAKFGGCGIIPSGAYHLELPTTVPDRGTNAPEFVGRLFA